MNLLDTELIVSALELEGWERARVRENADVILFNTCSVRQHAEDKVYSALGRLRVWKEENPQRVLGILGCMAQKDQATIFRRAPHVDLVIGPGRLDLLLPRLRELVSAPRHASRALATRVLEISSARTREEFHQFESPCGINLRPISAREFPFSAYVRVMFGCNRFCSYCIVPSVRGTEQSRPPQQIFNELHALANQACIEVTFIGQTVNSYRYREGEKTTRLVDLLEYASAMNAFQRIRFLTSYPRGMDDAILDAVATLPNLAPFFHVPAQSGSDAVLARMQRNYTQSEYRELIERIRTRIPHAAIVSDFIVGFCGETENDFAATVDLVRWARFKNSYIFKYSPRAGTAANELADDVPEKIKRHRNQELLAVQNEICLELNQELIGKKVEVLVEGINQIAGENEEKKQLQRDENLESEKLIGRTSCDRIVVFDGDVSLIGKIVSVKIESAAPFTLFGEL